MEAALPNASSHEDPLPALHALLAAVNGHNPFYTRKLGFTLDEAPPASIDGFRRRVPFTTKADLVADQASHPPYGSNLTEPLDRYTRCHQTSGTTGSPLRWLDTPESWSAMVDDWTQVLTAAGVHRGDRVLFAFSFGPFLGFWLAFEAAQRLGVLCLAGGGMSTALRTRVLQEHAATVLCCTPTYALHLAEAVATDSGTPRAPVRLLVVAGEPGGSLPATRNRLESAWRGARVFDHHGMTEVGPVSHEDPNSPGRLLVLESSFFAEVVDPVTGAPLPAEAEGELVLTTLRRTASPLLRYRTGDLVRTRRINGRLGLEGGILARTDDMVIVRGVNVYPTAVDEIVRGHSTISEYRVTYDARPSLPELFLEIEANDSTAATLAKQLQAALALRVPVATVPAGSLPRFELKARRWRRLH